MDSEKFMIDGLAKRSGVKKSSIEYYIKKGLVPHVGHNKSLRRLYDESSVKRVKLIKELTMEGIALDPLKNALSKLSVCEIKRQHEQMPAPAFREWLRNHGVPIATVN